MDIYAWSHFRKKINSTLIPNSDDKITISGFMRNSDPFSIYNPVIHFSDTSPGFSAAVPPYKYFFISDFGNRYYYVVDWVHTQGIWSAHLREDVLASEKVNIGLHGEYILRSSYTYNPYIIDTKYPTISKMDTGSTSISSVTVSHLSSSYTETSMFNKSLSGGTFVIGVAGDNGLSGVTYYAMDSSEFKKIIGILFDYTPEDIGEVIGIIARAVLKPIQWITSVYWMPIRFSSLWTAETYRDVNFGYAKITAIRGKILDPAITIRCQASFNIIRHPQYDSRGRYLNSSAYTSYVLDFQPFGTFDINPDIFVDDGWNQVSAIWSIDVATGEAFLRLRAGETLISATSTNFCIPLRLTESEVDVLGTTSAIVSNVGSLMAKSGSSESVSNTITHNDIFRASKDSEGSNVTTDKSNKVNETITTTETYNNPGASVGGLISALPHALQMPLSVGGAASFNAFSVNTPTLYARFSILVDEAIGDIGRPLCQFKRISNIPGYIQCEQGHFKGATLIETDEVNKYLVGGFYYE